jgi:transposase
MTPKQLIDRIGGGSAQAAAARLGVTRACVYHWKRTGRVSAAGQLKAQRLSNGKLKAR